MMEPRVNTTNRKIRDIDDNFFSEVNLINTYYGGLLAADGNIGLDGKTLQLCCAIKDKQLISDFLSKTKATYEITSYVDSEGHESARVSITSNLICYDLKKHFNITPQKSETLQPPNLTEESLIDAFIVGYIDGDGYFGLIPPKKDRGVQKRIQMQIGGTLEMCQWIEKRFHEILGTTKSKIYERPGLYLLSYTDKQCRNLISHFSRVLVPKLKRKWNDEIIAYCNDFKPAPKVYVKKYDEVLYTNLLRLKKQGLTNIKIAELLGITPRKVSYHINDDYFKKLLQI